jgi:hypothetical protein
MPVLASKGENQMSEFKNLDPEAQKALVDRAARQIETLIRAYLASEAAPESLRNSVLNSFFIQIVPLGFSPEGFVNIVRVTEAGLDTAGAPDDEISSSGH